MLTGIVMNDRPFLEAYSKWMPLQHKLEDAGMLGVPNFSPGSFGDCPACAKVPSFHDEGISATCAAADAAMNAADAFLAAAQAQVCIFMASRPIYPQFCYRCCDSLSALSDVRWFEECKGQFPVNSMLLNASSVQAAVTSALDYSTEALTSCCQRFLCFYVTQADLPCAYLLTSLY